MNAEKKNYDPPALELVLLSREDIVTTSPTICHGIDLPIEPFNP